MTAEEFKAHLRRLGFTQRGFSRWLGQRDASARTVRRWASGSRDVPEAVADQLRTLQPARRDQT